MPPSEPLEKSGNPASYPTNGTFAELLDWHCNYGTRPGANPDRGGTRWSDKEFGAAVTGRSPDEDTCRKSSRNWRTGKARPNDLGRIEQVLFGSNPAYGVWRLDLRAAYDCVRQAAPITSSSSIPPRPAHFLGRDADVDAIVSVLLTAAGPACVLVQGAPGIGKTALTRAVGHHPEIVCRFGQANRWFVELDAANTAAALQDAITRAVGGDPARGFAATLERLGRTTGLLVLDNFETPWDSKFQRSAAEAVLAELAVVPNLAVLASFRGHDVVRGVAWAYIHPVAHLDPPHDTELFCRIANWQRRDDPDLPRLVDALGGVPLAIELVAAHAYGQSSLAPLSARWVRKGVELAKHPDFDQGRLTSLPHSIELSLASSRLTPDAYRLFRLLGQLPAGLSEQDRDVLLGDEGFDAQGALRRIGLAVDWAGRLDLLPPIRDHAARHHAPDQLDAATWPAHYLALTKRIGEAIGTKVGDGAVSRLVPEFANIESAIRVVLKAGRRVEVMTALAGFSRLSVMASLRGGLLADLAEACRSDGDVLGAANCIKCLGETALRRSDHDGARQAFDEALHSYRQIGDALGAANCIFNIGEIALRRTDHEGARRAYEEALLLYRQVGDVLGEANSIRGLGEIALRRSDHEGAGQAFEEALPLYRRIGVVLGEANCVRSLGEIARRRSDHDGARRAHEEALLLYRHVGDVLGEANCITVIGQIALRRSDHDGARRAYEEALLLYRHVGDVLGEANSISNIGEIALARSDHAGAGRAFEEALPLYRQIGDLLGEANCIASIGQITLRRSDYTGAEQAFEAALPLYRRLGDVLGEANCIRILGEIALRRSDLEGGMQASEEALILYQQVGDKLGEANCISDIGQIALRRSDHERAKRAFEEALLLYRQVGDVLGKANCIRRLGEITLRRSDHAGARQAFEEALLLYRRIGDVLGEANCISNIGQIAFAQSDHAGAGQAFERALPFYRRIGDVLGEANCIASIGEIALARSDHDGARQAFEVALLLYRKIRHVDGETACIRRLEAR